MTEENTKKKDSLEKLNRFLRQNKKMDWQTAKLTNEQTAESLNWKGIEDKTGQVLKQVKAYQRLYRLLEEMYILTEK